MFSSLLLGCCEILATRLLAFASTSSKPFRQALATSSDPDSAIDAISLCSYLSRPQKRTLATVVVLVALSTARTDWRAGWFPNSRW